MPGVGPGRFYRLLNEYGSMRQAWQAPAEELKLIIGEKVLKARDETAATWDPDLELKKLDHLQFRLYCQSEPDYPAILKQIFRPAPGLICVGWF